MARVLNAKMEMFCDEYVIDFNGTQAAIRAGYSKKTANRKAYQLLRIVEIQNYISELKKELSTKNLWSREQSIKALVNIVEGTIVIDGQEVRAQDKDIIAAVKQLNLMHGFNEPKRIDNTSSDGSMATYKEPTKQEILQQLIDAGIDPKKVSLNE